MAGNWVVVGASIDDTNALNGGIAYVFDATDGTLVSTLSDPFAADSDLFGDALTIAGTTVSVGAPLKDMGAIDSGAVYVFDALSGTHLRTLISQIPVDGGFFGGAVSSNHELLVVGSNREDSTVEDAGAAYFFDAVTGDYIDRVVHPDAASFDNFGLSVSVGPDVVAVGAPTVDGLTTDRGRVYLFESRDNTPPVAVPAGPYQGFEALPFALDASGSSDAEDPFASLVFEWDLDYDGITFDVDASGVSPTVSFADDIAARPMALRVTDTEGLSTIAETTIEVLNQAPTITTDLASISADEGAPASNSGSFGDAGDDTVSLSASLGTVIDNGDGTWSWSWDTQDGPDDSATVTITATDSDGAATDVMFDLTVNNVAPQISADEGSLSVLSGATATNTGSYFDPGVDTIQLTASLGDVVDLGGGLWSWSLDTTGLSGLQTVTVTATDSDTASQFTTFDLDVELIIADQSAVSATEGTVAVNTGSYADPGAETVTLTASVGTIMDNGDGTWSWSHPVTDGPDSESVTVTADYSGGATDMASFDLTTDNAPPTVTVDEGSIAVLEGALATNTGSYFDPGVDTIQLTASLGTVIDNGDGTWSWSLDTTGLSGLQTVTITATDSDTASQFTTFDLDVELITADLPGVTATEGTVAVNTGLYADPGAETVMLDRVGGHDLGQRRRHLELVTPGQRRSGFRVGHGHR